MKQTRADRDFARRFGEALNPHISRERELGKSWAQIGSELGVTGNGLQKQLAGGTPSIRTIAFAYRKYGLSVRYQGIEVAKAISGRRKGKRASEGEGQLQLPFEITAPPSSKRLLLMPVSKGLRRYRLQLTIGMSR